MNAVVAISPVSSSSPAGTATAVSTVRAAVRAAVTATDQAKTKARVAENVGESTAKPAAQVQDQSVPTAVMSSASAPPANNELATMEYLAMRSHLASGDTAAAQEAYIRLQTALELFAPSSGAVKPAQGGLNASA